MKILVIDDSDKIRDDIRRALTEHGYEVIEAVDGADGLEQLRTRRDLALALCDVNMPRMTGIEMLAELRSSGTSTTPVVMLTTEGQPSLIRRAREFGAKGWIMKPFRIDLLLGAVRKLIPPAA